MERDAKRLVPAPLTRDTSGLFTLKKDRLLAMPLDVGERGEEDVADHLQGARRDVVERVVLGVPRHLARPGVVLPQAGGSGHGPGGPQLRTPNVRLPRVEPGALSTIFLEVIIVSARPRLRRSRRFSTSGCFTRGSIGSFGKPV